MSIAAPIDVVQVSDALRPDVVGPGVVGQGVVGQGVVGQGVVGHGMVVVHNYGFGHSAAACSCGWTGRRRYLKAAAEQDAWVHSIHEKCAIAVPLVIPFSAP